MPKTAKLDTFSKRLAYLFQKSGLSYTEFAALCKTGESTARKWVFGDSVPSAKYVIHIVRATCGGEENAADTLWFLVFGED